MSFLEPLLWFGSRGLFFTSIIRTKGDTVSEQEMQKIYKESPEKAMKKAASGYEEN
ncbi:hypothetical protein O9992_00775 [Vibrio lentus]|nr:hypothetical protein [Vibrio lentus]